MKVLLLENKTCNLMEVLLYEALETTKGEIEEMEINKVFLKDEELDYYNDLNNYKIEIESAINEFGIRSFGGIREN